MHVAVVGKYTVMPDAYLSVVEALRHASISLGVASTINLVDAESVTRESAREVLGGYDAIVVPGGYGKSGTDGMIETAHFARETGTPFLAIGYGMQMAVVEAARSLLGHADAHTNEVDGETAHPVVRIPEDRVCQNDSRSAARMGAGMVRLADGILRQAYGADTICERHSNRYEVDPAYVPALAEKGLRMVGSSAEAGYPEAFELEGHPYYALVVYHPEYQSRPGKPHPLFMQLVKAGLKK